MPFAIKQRDCYGQQGHLVLPLLLLSISKKEKEKKSPRISVVVLDHCPSQNIVQSSQKIKDIFSNHKKQ